MRLLRICLIISEKVRQGRHWTYSSSLTCTQPSLRDQVYLSLDLLANLPSDVTTAVAEQVVEGVVHVVKGHRSIIRCVIVIFLYIPYSSFLRSPTEWGMIFALMRNTMGNSRAARQSFDLLLSLCSDGPEKSINSDNFVGIVNLLNDFGTAASIETNSRNPRSRPTQTIPESSQYETDVIVRYAKLITCCMQASNCSRTTINRRPL